MSNTQNTGFDNQNLTEVLKHIKKEYGRQFLSWDERMNSILGDYAPELREERLVIKRMMQRGILNKFSQADSQDADKKNRVIKESEMCLVQEEFLLPDKVKYYLQVFSDVYGWGIQVSSSVTNFKCDFKEADVKRMAAKLRQVVETSPRKYLIWNDELGFLSCFNDLAPELKGHMSLLKWLYQAADMDLHIMIKNLGNASGVSQDNLRLQVKTIQMKLTKLAVNENAVAYIIASILESFNVKYKDYLELTNTKANVKAGTTGAKSGASGTKGTSSGKTGQSSTQQGGTQSNTTQRSTTQQVKNSVQSTSTAAQNRNTQNSGKNTQSQSTATGSYRTPVKKKKKKWLWIIIIFCVFDFFAMRFMMNGPSEDRDRDREVKQEQVEEVEETTSVEAEATSTPTPTPSGPDYDYNPETTGITEAFDIDLGSSAQEQPYRMNVLDKRTYREFIGYDDFCFKYPHSVYTEANFVNNGQGEDIQITFTSKHEASSMFVQSCSKSASGYSGALAEIKNQIMQEESAKMTNVSVVEEMTDMSECRFYLSGYEAETGLYMYDAVTVKENRIYRMVIKFPSGELDAIRKYYADTMYRLCEFTGGGVQETQSYEDFCKKLGVSSELTFMSGGVPR